MGDQMAVLIPELLVWAVKLLVVATAGWLAVVALRLLNRGCWP
jgi:hypothetical protein